MAYLGDPNSAPAGTERVEGTALARTAARRAARPAPRELLIGLPLALLAGLAVGVLGTFKHQVGISATTGGGFPLGLLASLGLVAVVLAALRVAFPTRLYAAAAGVGVVVAVFVLSLHGPGGSVVVLANAAGTVWSVAPAIATVIVVGAPRIRHRGPTGPSGAMTEGDGMMAVPTEGSGPA